MELSQDLSDTKREEAGEGINPRSIVWGSDVHRTTVKGVRAQEMMQDFKIH